MAALGLSYPTRISDDTHSALVAFNDRHELFCGEIRILAAVDFKDGKVVRPIDYGTAAHSEPRPRPRCKRLPTSFPPISTTTSRARVHPPRSEAWRKSLPPLLPRATPRPPTSYLAMTRFTSIARCVCASSASSRLANTCPACSRPCRRAAARSLSMSSPATTAVATSGPALGEARLRRHRPQRCGTDRAARHDLDNGVTSNADLQAPVSSSVEK
jgi:hypothetical protein